MPIESFLSNISLGQEVSFKNMTIFPIISDNQESNNFIMIDEAIKNSQVKISEISDMGDVPYLCLNNASNNKIFILDGEELVGAKQNRAVNSVIIAKENNETILPVSCVERSRWNYKTKYFSSSNSRAYFRLRKKIFETELNNKNRRIKDHPQHDVWNDIDNKMQNMKVSSTTNAMNDIYKTYFSELEKFNKKIKLAESQVGLIVFINNKFVSLELFNCCNIIQSLYEKILNSYAIDAIEAYSGEVRKLKTLYRKARKFLNEVKTSVVTEYDSAGLGTDIILNSESMYGSALQYDGKVVYMSVYHKVTTH